MWRWEKNSSVIKKIKKNGTFVEKGKKFSFFFFLLKEEVVLVLDN